MAKEVSLKDATVTIVMELGGQVHLVAMDKRNHEAVVGAIKMAAEHIVPAGVTQRELNDLLLRNQKKKK